MRGDLPKICLSALPSSEDPAARDNDGCFVCIVDVDFIIVKDYNVVCMDKLGDAEERVVINSWYDVFILCWVAHVVMEFVYVACLFHLAIGHGENLVQLSSCCDECVSVSVFFGSQRLK
jgi:hypothetical protein